MDLYTLTTYDKAANTLATSLHTSLTSVIDAILQTLDAYGANTLDQLKGQEGVEYLIELHQGVEA